MLGQRRGSRLVLRHRFRAQVGELGDYGRILERLGTEVGIDWTDGDGATTFADRPDVERLYLGWLGLTGGPTGVLLWPAVVLHVILSGVLAYGLATRR